MRIGLKSFLVSAGGYGDCGDDDMPRGERGGAVAGNLRSGGELADRTGQRVMIRRFPGRRSDGHFHRRVVCHH